MTDLTHILGKPFRLGARGPQAYDCVGVAIEVVRAHKGGAAAAALPCGETSRASGEIPSGWVRVAGEPYGAAPGDVVLTARTGEDGEVEQHLYVGVGFSKFATSDRKRGAIVVPLRAIQDEVVGVYRWGGAA